MTNGMMTWELTNSETGEVVSYDALDLQCAKMLAAEDHGGDEDDWLTEEEVAELAE